jgi:hypothetical protein
MKIKRTLLPIAVATALLVSPKTYAQSWNLNLFPELPLSRSIMADSDISKNEINLPSGLERNLLNRQVKEIIPRISLSKEIPILSFNLKSKKIPGIIPSEVAMYSESQARERGLTLSDEIFSASLVTGGKLRFPKDENPKYVAQAELFLSSPMMDDYLSDGNRLLLIARLEQKGSINLSKIEEATIKELPEFLTKNYNGISGDVYVIAKSPYSKQFLILRGGINNLLGNSSEEQNFNFSSSVEFPSLTWFIKELKNFKILPYISFSTKTPLDGSQGDISGEIGTKLTGESDKSILMYGRANYGETKNEYSLGLKLEL